MTGQAWMAGITAPATPYSADHSTNPGLPAMAPMDLETAARCFAELGHPTRLAIYRRLVQAGDDGMPVGALGEELGVIPSTLSHHVKQLLEAGLISQQRDGRILYCRPIYPRMDALLAFLREECCARPVPRPADSAKQCC